MNRKQFLIDWPEGCLADGCLRGKKYFANILIEMLRDLGIKYDTSEYDALRDDLESDYLLDSLVDELIDLANSELHKHNIDLSIEFYQGDLMFMHNAWWSDAF